MRVLVTGGLGLVGIESCKLFAKRGWSVVSVDNYTRGRLFGKEGDTRVNRRLLEKYGIEHVNADVTSDKVLPLIKGVDAVIHTAAQPSHPKSIEIPMEDFRINAYGTLHLLELLRQHNKDAVFVFCSTNKVYGDAPNHFAYQKVEKRFEPVDPSLRDGFGTDLRIDRSMHTPFGVSKATADLYTQEYSYLYGQRTGVFRMGCITGGAARAVEMHNWEPYFIRKAIRKEKLTIFGHKGYQVRDVIHAEDLANLFYAFVSRPRPGEVYNVGGGRSNSISLLEAIDLIDEVTGCRLKYDFGKEREGDHIWWISNLDKVRSHFPEWNLRHDLRNIFTELYETLSREQGRAI